MVPGGEPASLGLRPNRCIPLRVASDQDQLEQISSARIKSSIAQQRTLPADPESERAFDGVR